MDLAEARQVLWLHNRPKPLGDLLDEGYLDSYRLEWAAAKAYNPRLKEAARVLLEWRNREALRPQDRETTGEPVMPKRPPVTAGITLDEARSVTWPFAPRQGQPMGVLSETRQLTLKDLAYAAECARDPHVRRAAIALLLVRLGQEVEESAVGSGAPAVYAPEWSHAERRQHALSMLQGGIMGGLLAASGAMLVATLRQTATVDRTVLIARATASPIIPSGLAVALMLVVLMVAVGILAPNWILGAIDRRIGSYRQGQRGEDRVFEVVLRALDGEWTVFRNLTLPGRRRGDLDLVLVGPPGVWALEVKAYQGKYRNMGEVWEKRAGQSWKRLRKSPSRQAVNAAASLGRFLQADGLRTFVIPAVVWANEERVPQVENPTVAVWAIDRLEDEVGNLWNGKRLDSATKERILAKLAVLGRWRRE
jgi:hypothetical protein